MMRHPIKRTVIGHDSARFKHGLAIVENTLAVAFDRPRILVADDDPLTGALVSSIRDRGSCDVVSVKDGRESVRLLSRDSSFSAAIFNLTMPHLQGVDVIRYMKTEKRLMRIPVIIIGDGGGLKSVAECFDAGAIAFLAKPLTADTLQQIVRLVLDTQVRSKQIRQAA